MAQRDEPDRGVAEIRARVERIERTRARMGETVEEIGAHLNPQHLKTEFQAGLREQVDRTKREIRGATIGRAQTLMHNVEETVNHTSRTLMDTIRDNPVPAAMAGIGLGWLLTDVRRHQTDHGGREHTWGGVASTEPGYVGAYGYTAPPMRTSERARASGAGAMGTAHEGAENARGRAREAASNASEQARDVRDRAQDTVSDAAERARMGAADLSDRAQERMDDVRHGAENAWHAAEERARDAQYQTRRLADENPLATGAIALALGFAAGMMIPESQPERRMMGPTRDRLMHRAQEATLEAADRAAEAVEETADRARERAERTLHENEPMSASGAEPRST